MEFLNFNIFLIFCYDSRDMTISNYSVCRIGLNSNFLTFDALCTNTSSNQYLQIQCAEKCQFELCSKYDRVANMLIYRVSQQFLTHNKFILSGDMSFMSRQRLHYTITVKHLNTAKDAFPV